MRRLLSPLTWVPAAGSIGAAFAFAACFMGIDEGKIGARDGADGEGAHAGTRDGASAAKADETQAAKDGSSDAAPLAGGCLPCDDGWICREARCVLPQSCRDQKEAMPTATTGLYDFTLDDATVPLYCDMDTDGGGWTLVTRISAGVAGDAYDIFIGPALNEDVRREVTPNQTASHYVSRLVSKWNKGMTVSQARVRVNGVGGAKLAELLFDAQGSATDDFFSIKRLKASPWTDIASAAYFSAAGDGSGVVDHRRFLIHGVYRTCDTDIGWLMVHGTLYSPVCPFESPTDKIRIWYSKNAIAQQWKTHIDEANSLAIYVR